MIALLLAALLGLLVPAARAGPVRVPADRVDAARADELFRGRRLALLVGPESFADEALPDLAWADDDARALGAVLADPDRGAFDDVRVLTAPNVTRLAAVRRAMARLEAESRSPDDTVFVYFSTHGSLARDARGDLRQYLVLSDTRLADLPGTGLSHAEVLGWLDRLPSRRKVLVLATCHSGQGKSALPPDVAEELAHTKGAPPVPPLRAVSEAVVLIGVCAWNETARESDELGHDIYTAFFLEALADGDLDGDGAVTITEAHDQARRRTWTWTGGAQRPYARAEILGVDPVVLTGRRGAASAGTLGSWQGRWDGYRVAVDGQEKGALPGLVAVGPGRHRVEILAPGGERVVARSRVRLREGQTLEIDRLVRRDRLRLGGGGGWLGASPAGAGGPVIGGELHLPRLPGAGWELVLSGSAVARWPGPSLQGAAVVEHGLRPGALQPRLGVGLVGFLLSDGEGSLLAPSLVPAPSAAVVWLPRSPVFVRLGVVGGYLWFTDRGSWRHGWMAEPSLVGGLGW